MNIWHEILSVATHAPSPHNVQPWQIKLIDDRNADLFVCTTRTLPKEDLTGSFIISTMGIFVEAVKIVSASRGYILNFELNKNIDQVVAASNGASEGSVFVAKLHLEPTRSVESDFDDELLQKRRTSRLHLKSIPPEEGALERLKTVAAEWGQEFFTTTDNTQIERVLRLNTSALFEDLNSKNYREEIVSWFRYTRKQSERHRDGLDARCMNTSAFNYWLVANFPAILKLPVLRSVMSGTYRRQTGYVPSLGVIAGDFWDPTMAFTAGRSLMRFWLEAAKADLYIHPFGNLVTNEKAADALKKEFSKENIWLVFKIGYSDVPPKSLRLPLENILID